jgi:hypothetical protein
MSKTTPDSRQPKAQREDQGGTVAQRALERSKGRRGQGFSEKAAIAKLAAEQAVKLEGQFERIFGTRPHVWSSDEEFEQAVQQIYDKRLESRKANKQ